MCREIKLCRFRLGRLLAFFFLFGALAYGVGCRPGVFVTLSAPLRLEGAVVKVDGKPMARLTGVNGGAVTWLWIAGRPVRIQIEKQGYLPICKEVTQFLQDCGSEAYIEVLEDEIKPGESPGPASGF
jgi:hypothetical protein